MPHVTGRLSVHRLSVPAFWLIFSGFNVTFLTMHLTGLLGMPRRVYTYMGHEGWTALNLVSSVGSFVLTMGFALIAIDILLQRRHGPRFRRDPWRAGTLEWATPTPPAAYGFASLPRVGERADRLAPGEVGRQMAAGQGYLGFARNGWQETLGVDITTGEPDQVVILPRPTYLPLVLALSTGIVVLALLFKVYAIAIVAAMAVCGLFVWGARNAGQPIDHGQLPIGLGLAVPPHPEAETSPALLAMVFTLVADGTLFVALVFGVIYLWLVAPNWPPADVIEAGLSLPFLALAGLLAGPLAARGAIRAIHGQGRVTLWLALQGGMLVVAIAAVVTLIAVCLPDPRIHGYAAGSFALLAYVCLHLGITALFVISNAMRHQTGYIGSRRDHDLRLTRAWQDFTAVSGLVAVAFVLILPHLMSGGSL
jgi:cytochrome c oxidase subunit I+III